MLQHFTEFRRNQFITTCVDKQTDRQTDTQTGEVKTKPLLIFDGGSLLAPLKSF